MENDALVEVEPEPKKKKYPKIRQLVQMWEESLTVFELSGLRHRYETDSKVFYRSCLSLIADLGEPHRDPQMHLDCRDIYREVEAITPRILSGTNIYSHIAKKHTAHCLYCQEPFQTVKGRLCSSRCNRYFKRSKLEQSLAAKQLALIAIENEQALALLTNSYDSLADTVQTESTLGLTPHTSKESALEETVDGLVDTPNSS